MKILIDGTVLESPPSGIAKVIFHLYSACMSLCPDLKVCLFHQRPLGSPVPSSVQCHRIMPILSAKYWRRYALPVAALFMGEVIHFPWNGSVPRLMGRATVITTVHDLLPLEIPDYFQTAGAREGYMKNMRSSLLRTNLLITDSEYSKSQIERWFRPAFEPQVIYPASTMDNISACSFTGPSDLHPFFLYSGGYHPRKGLLPLLRIFIDLYETGKIKQSLYLTGDKVSFSDNLESLLTKGKRIGAVRELGYVSNEYLKWLYQHAVALIYPSKYEGFGLPPLEAMSLGCPVVTCRATSIPEVCGKAALYADPSDENAFSEALVAVSTNESLREALRQKGLAQAKRFSWKASASLFLDEIRKTLEKRKSLA